MGSSFLGEFLLIYPTVYTTLKTLTGIEPDYQKTTNLFYERSGLAGFFNPPEKSNYSPRKNPLNLARYGSKLQHVLPLNAKVRGLPGTRRISPKTSSTRNTVQKRKSGKRNNNSKSSRPNKRRAT